MLRTLHGACIITTGAGEEGINRMAVYGAHVGECVQV